MFEMVRRSLRGKAKSLLINLSALSWIYSILMVLAVLQKFHKTGQ